MSSGEITFYMKGADTVMSSIVQYNDWLEEEVRLLGRGGSNYKSDKTVFSIANSYRRM